LNGEAAVTSWTGDVYDLLEISICDGGTTLATTVNDVTMLDDAWTAAVAPPSGAERRRLISCTTRRLSSFTQ